MRTNANFGVSGFRSQYLVLAKDARFQLRQYPMLRTTPRGFEPLRSKTTHLAGEPLNHSGKVSFSLAAASTGSRNYGPKNTRSEPKKKMYSMSGNRTPGVCVGMSLNPVLFQKYSQIFVFHRFAFSSVFEQILSKIRKFALKIQNTIIFRHFGFSGWFWV